jgi:hypothetical protein
METTNDKMETTNDNIVDEDNTIHALLLLLLAVMGNYVAETLSCQVQNVLTNSMVVKSVVIFCLIYFTMTLTSTTIVHPGKTLIQSVVLWISFMLITKMNIYFSSAVFVLLMYIFVLSNFKSYYKKTKNKEQELLMKKHIRMGKKVFIGISCVGFITYFYKQYTEHSDFSFLKFITGVPKCGYKGN